MHVLKKVVVAIAVCFPTGAMAQTNQELKAELAALKAQVQRLEAMIDKVDAAELNRVRVKTEAMEDASEANGFKGFKISGYIDPEQTDHPQPAVRWLTRVATGISRVS
jgi:N-methylhydantoinase B/oxoprolinase/acetone carboxylase alpha subunit